MKKIVKVIYAACGLIDATMLGVYAQQIKNGQEVAPILIVLSVFLMLSFTFLSQSDNKKNR